MVTSNSFLKGLIIQRYGTQKSFLIALEDGGLSMGEARLSRIIHRRAKPTPEEVRMIAWKLQRSIGELFDG